MALSTSMDQQGAGMRTPSLSQILIAIGNDIVRWSRRLRMAPIFFIAAFLFGLMGCGQSLPDPVEKKDGLVYIPIDDTAFLIPEKTWLKSYARNSTDGLVCCITLHATIPDVQPWSQARHEEMYLRAGPGKKLDISIMGGVHLVQSYSVPRSKRAPGEFIEEPSDQSAQGLRRFRQLWLPYSDEEAKKDTVQFGADFVERMREHSGKPMMDRVFYEFVEHDRIKYLIDCEDDFSPHQLFQSCNLHFPLGQTLMVTVQYFDRKYISDIVSMANKLSDKLHEFEAAGLAYRAAKSQSNPPSSRQ